MIPGFTYDPDLAESIAQRFDLRPPVQRGFEAAIEALADGYDPAVPLVLDLATGAGKTYLMAALVEYLREYGVRDVLVVTPSSVVQAKTVANFTQGHPKYIDGSLSAPFVITPADYDKWVPTDAKPSLLGSGDEPVQLFILNVHQLTAPQSAEGETSSGKKDAVRRAFRTFRETSGHLRDYLRDLENLVIIADEHHLYGDTAKAFQAGIRELGPAAIVGLTASASDEDYVLYRYTLKEAIGDKYVKRPVIAYRKGGYGKHDEEQQLRDALSLLTVKQEHYENYQQTNPSAPKISAALFVQCIDVAHATHVASLLRGPEFFGSDKAVLQVDNEHDDVQTLDRLSKMDEPDSPVRAVVSVNKLKEGWDVKNVAVMVTLRAMTSEILTQQTLGRGLRLPFGKWTGTQHIDQLDIIAHESFRNLLKEEEVLKSFGLEDLTKHPGPTPAKPEPAPTTSPSAEEAGGTGTSAATEEGTRLSQGDGSPFSNSSESAALPTAPGNATVTTIADGAVTLIELDDDAAIGGEKLPEPKTVRINTAFEGTTFTFPATSMSRETSPFTLSSIPDAAVKEAASKISDQADTMLREAIVFKGKLLGTASEDDVKVGGIHVDKAEVVETLVKNVVGLKVVEPSAANLSQVKARIVPLLVNEATVEQWSVKALRSALHHLREVVQHAATEHSSRLGTVTTVHPRELPIATEYRLPTGKEVLDLLPAESKGEGFKRFEHYGPWSRGLFDAAKFDSFSAEYRIAAMLNRSGSIGWWKRLYPEDKATIAYTITNDYNPDFVALDKDGYHWIIEGKSESGKDDATVQAKRAAAEEAIRLLVGHPDFDGQKWGYVIAYESDVKLADSWDDLLASTNPVMTIDYGDQP